MGLFDDLIPTTRSGGLFDDLIPADGGDQVSRAATRPPEPVRATAQEPATSVNPEDFAPDNVSAPPAYVPTPNPASPETQALMGPGAIDALNARIAATPSPITVDSAGSFAEASRQRNAQLNQPGSIRTSDYDFDTRAAHKDDNALERGGYKGLVNLQQQSLGLRRFYGDVTGDSALAADMAKEGARMARMDTATGEGNTAFEKNVVAATSSIVSQLPGLAAGVATGGATLPLSEMFVGTFGQEYEHGRTAGKSVGEATTRAGLYGAAEVLGEVYSIGPTMKAVLGAAKGVPTHELSTQLAKMFLAELPGEQATTLMEFLVDKSGKIGLAPEATFADYLEQAGQTLTQTITQSAMMGGGLHGVHLARGTGSAHQTALAEADAEAAKTRALDKASKLFSPGAKVAPVETAPAVLNPVTDASGSPQQPAATPAQGDWPTAPVLPGDQAPPAPPAGPGAAPEAAPSVPLLPAPTLTGPGAQNGPNIAVAPTMPVTEMPANPAATEGELNAYRVEQARQAEEARLAALAPHQIEIDPANPAASIAAIAAAPLPTISPQLSTPTGLDEKVHADAAGTLADTLAQIQALRKSEVLTPVKERPALKKQIAALEDDARAFKLAYGSTHGEEAATHMHTVAARTAAAIRGDYKGFVKTPQPVVEAKPVQEKPVSTEREQAAKTNATKLPTMYHGGDTVAIRRDGFKSSSGAVYFTTDREEARGFSEENGIFEDPISADLQLDNPLVTTDKNLSNFLTADRVSALRAQGYDGVILKDGAGAIVEAAVFDLKKIGSTARPVQRQERILTPVKDRAPMKGIAPPSTPAFKQWFGESKVVDAEGKPQVLYHGTRSDISTFKGSKDGSLGAGIYLTPDRERSDDYAGAPYWKPKNEYRDDAKGGNVMPVYASLKNPLVIDGPIKSDPMVLALTQLGMTEAKAQAMVERAYENKGYISTEVKSRAQKAGHDGIMQYRDGELSEVVVWDPAAVKSATGNNGEFNRTNPDIRKSVTADDVAWHIGDDGKLVKPKGKIRSFGSLIAGTVRGTAQAETSAGAQNAQLLHKATPGEVKSLLEGHARNTTPDEKKLFAAIMRDSYKSGMPTVALAGLGDIHVYKPVDDMEDARHWIMANGETTMGFREDLVRNALDGHAPSLAAIKHYFDHETGHELDSAQAVSEAYASSQSPLFTIKSTPGGRKAVGGVVAEVKNAYFSTKNAALKDYLSYPMSMWDLSPKEMGQPTEEMANQVLQAETFAQLVSMWYNNRELLRTAMPESFNLMKELHADLGRIVHDRRADRAVAEAVHRALRTGLVTDSVSADGPRARRETGRRFGEREADSGVDLLTQVGSKFDAYLAGKRATGTPGLKTESKPDILTPVSERQTAEQKAAKALDRKVAKSTNSAARDIRQNNEKPLGTKSVEVDDVGRYFDKLIRDEFGGPLDYNNPVHVARAVELMRQEFRYQLTQAKSGLDWYSEDIKGAFEMTATIIPELHNELHRQLFGVTTALMSPGTKAHDNWNYGAIAYKQFTETGVIPETKPQEYGGELWGVYGATTAKAIAQVNSMIDEMGRGPATEWLMSAHTIQEINRVKHKYGHYKDAPVGGKMLDQQLGVYMFGEKVGPFSLNVLGMDTEVTVDVWLTRTFNRMFGTMFHDSGKKAGEMRESPSEPERRVIKGMIEAVAKSEGYSNSQVQAVLWFFEQGVYTQLGAASPSMTFSDGARVFLANQNGATNGSADSESSSRAPEDAAGNGDEEAVVPKQATLGDFTKGKVADLIHKDGWAVLTAENPANEPATTADNKRANRKLEADLKSMGLNDYQKVIGRYGGGDENSFVVTGITQEQADTLRDRYGQDAYLDRRGFVHGDGTVTPATAITEKPDSESDFYTVMPNGLKWAADINFDARSKPDSELEARFPRGMAAKNVRGRYALETEYQDGSKEKNLSSERFDTKEEAQAHILDVAEDFGGGIWQDFKLNIVDTENPRGMAEVDGPWHPNNIENASSNKPRGMAARAVQAINAPPGNPATWTAPTDSKLDTFIHAMQDKHVDTKRVVQAITQNVQAIHDSVDVYLQEELFHGRAAKKTQDFLDRELKPLVADMAARGVQIDEFEEYLHNRHAEERNDQIAKVNPKYPDGGSGIDTADARAYLAGLTADKRMKYEALARRVDAMTAGTAALMVAGRLESQDTINAWRGAYKSYVPLHREDMDAGGPGTGQGFSTTGKSKRATGSSKNVENILGNIALAREQVITRSEKNRISNALVALAGTNPNRAFWEVDRPPTITYIAQNGLAVTTVDPNFKRHDNVVVARMDDGNGGIVERAVIFNKHDERAARMAASIKNVDAEQLHGAVKFAAGLTRYVAAINTQYNPIFGVVNLTRDVGTGMFNLSTTDIKGQQGKVLAKTLPALVGIFNDLRAHRKGQARTGGYGALFESMQDAGGQTGYRDLFMTGADRGNAIAAELKRAQGGGFAPFTETFRWLGGLISDYNTAMENAVRVSAYKVAQDSGLTDARAASLAKNLTVNFNRKGAKTLNAGALYAFFNASVQGNARVIETLKGPQGMKIILGGVTFGVLQAMLLAAAGFDDDEPPEFIKERNIIIPIGGKKYLTIPMPQGMLLVPNVGRIAAEYALSGFRKPGQRVRDGLSLALDSFSPIGGGNSWSQMLTPTILDPIVALGQNMDWTGKPIAREDFNPLAPTPGPLRAKEGASPFSKVASEGINKATGGTDYKPGWASPTPDQIDYLIGQFTGGVGREIGKFATTVSGAATGETVPPHKIPLVGRFYGDGESVTGQSAKFYENLKEINGHEAEIKGRKAAHEDWMSYREENPTAALVDRANAVERDVSKLRKQKRTALAAGAERDDIRAIEEKINDKMTRFNELVKETR